MARTEPFALGVSAANIGSKRCINAFRPFFKKAAYLGVIKLTMNDLHIEDFYKNIATIFLQLYSTFPNKITLYIEDIGGPDTPDEFGLHSPKHLACLSAVIWLAEHNYLNFESTIRQEALDQVVLTEKAFLLLSSRSRIPREEQVIAAEMHPSFVLDEQSVNINLVSQALKEGSSTKLKNLMHQLMLLSREFR